MRKIFYYILSLPIMISASFPPTTKFHYVSYKDDPTGLRIYTLENGLKVYLARNEDQPQIQTFVTVKAGSVYDPVDNTGLAHYLEHMLFKGTSNMGTTNWAEEKKLLTQIADLYEQHKATTNEEEKKKIYHQIDSLSYQASAYVAPNEYDKMLTNLGAQDLNAYTSFERTVYQSIIPSNALDKWLTVERERFNELVLRLFHTELEAVYEEFNMSQDNDGRRAIQTFLKNIFPKHPYGQQTTIGTSEHLKNPSMLAIHHYFTKYYVPNNMAIVLVGDIDYDQTIELVNKHFGSMKAKSLETPHLPKEDPITHRTEKEVFGPNPASLFMGYRTVGVGTDEELYVTLLTRLLSNETAGLLDLNLNQQQKVQYCGANTFLLRDYGVQYFSAVPKQGQSLEEVRDLLLSEINKLKKGDFDEWMLKAVITQLKTERIKEFDNATATAHAFVEAFATDQNWQDILAQLDKLSKISKADIVKFANAFYTDNYVIVYKKQGEAKDVAHVQKPAITPVQIQNTLLSDFAKKIYTIPVPDIEPVFVDFDRKIAKTKFSNGIVFRHVENVKNDLFTLSYVYDMGEWNIKQLPIAIDYLDLLGTENYAPDQLKKEFYKLGVDVRFSSENEMTTFTISGLYSENIKQAVSLLEEYINHAKANDEVYAHLVDRIEKSRQDEMESKQTILRKGLSSLAIYGENSQLRNRYSIAELKAIQPQSLLDLLRGLKKYKHEIFYFGKHAPQVMSVVNSLHQTETKAVDYPKKKVEQAIEPSGSVYVCNYDMVQAEMLLTSVDREFVKADIPYIKVFNNYFGGGGLSSVVFQEIREKRALAYSAYAFYSAPGTKEKQYGLIYGYVGTQADKLPMAVGALSELMKNMPRETEKFEDAKKSALKEIQSDRVVKDNIYWYYKKLQQSGYDYDIRKDVYTTMKTIQIKDLVSFFEKHIKDRKYNYAILGKESNIDIEALKKWGEVKKVDVNYIFNQ